MSRAFVKDGEQPFDDLPDRVIPEHPNDVTREGMAQIEAALAAAKHDFAAAQAADDRGAMASASRDLRYWSSRRATVRIVPDPSDNSQVRFGSSVTIEHDDGRKQTFRDSRRSLLQPIRRVERFHMSHRWRGSCLAKALGKWCGSELARRKSWPSDSSSRRYDLNFPCPGSAVHHQRRCTASGTRGLVTPPPYAARVRPYTVRTPRRKLSRCWAGAQPLVIGLHIRPFRQFDRRRRHRPVDDGDEVGIRHAEMIEQEFAALQVVVEIVEPGKVLG